nr:hypothetical protein [Marinobacter sp. LV10R510-11A]
MDFATLIGLVGALALIASAVILGVSPDVFLNSASLLIVVGGTMLVVLAKFSIPQFLGAFKAAARAFKFKLPETQASIEKLVDVANVSRKEGVLGLEDREVAIQQGTNPRIIEQMLSSYLPPNQRDTAPEAEASSG